MAASTDNAPLDHVQRPPRRRVIFDPTINLGHVLSFVGFLTVGAGAYLNIEKRVTVQETRSIMFEREAEAEKARTGSSLNEIKNDMKEVRRGVDDLRSNINNGNGGRK